MNIKELKINNLATRIFEPSNEIREVLLAIHGFAGDKESSVIVAVAEMLAKNNIATISYDLPNHGGNVKSTPLILDECIKSVRHMIEYAKNEYKNLPISIFATSFGGFLLLQHLKKHNETFKNVILRSPAIDMGNILVKNILPEHKLSLGDFATPQNLGYAYELWVDNKFIDDLYTNNLSSGIGETSSHFHIMQGLQDDIVDPNFVFDYANKYFKNQHTLHIFENADHRYKKPGELERIVDIAKKILI